MLIAYRIALAVMGLSAIYAGILNSLLASGVVEKFYEVELTSAELVTALDLQVRILAGMWTALGLFVLFAIPNFGKYIVPLYFVFLGFALSALGEFATMVMLGKTADAMPKALLQVSISIGMIVWGYFAAKRTMRSV